MPTNTTDADVIDDPAFHIMTTLREILCGELDIASSPLVQRWEEENRALYALHLDRFQNAARAYGWLGTARLLESQHSAFTLQALVKAAIKQQFPKLPSAFVQDIRTRVLIDRAGNIQVEAARMGTEKPVQSLSDDWFFCIPQDLDSEPQPSDASLSKVYVDLVPTVQSSLTSHKSTYRVPYDKARARLGIENSLPGVEEVLLYNNEDQITEASLCTPYFYREGGWTAPASTSGGILSVTKMRALKAGFCVESVISLHSLQHGEIIWLSNALRGFFPGKICLEGRR